MANLSIEPNERVTFGIAHEDEHLLVVVKPPKLVTQPGVGHEHDTLLNGLFARFGERLQNLGAARDFGLVHRLDRETSGVLAVALSAEAYDGMRRRFAEREIRKFYWAVCLKAPREHTGVIKRPIAEIERRKSRYTSEKLARLDSGGKPAVTAYRVLDASPLAALLEARPVTGRLHQIRIHLDSIGCGILGDRVYGPTRTTGASRRLALHAHRLAFDHPVTGEPVDVRTAFPKDLRRLLRSLELERPDLEGGGAQGVPEPGDEDGEV
jgi:23S rRNA pseudouridine1911/1915/1917 synthase